MGRSKTSTGRTVRKHLGRIALGGLLVTAGIGHLTFARKDFQAQVPEFVPLDPDTTVVASGGVEIALGSALLFAPRSKRRFVGNVAAAFFVAVFPGNLAQWLHARDGFGLDTDLRRTVRLLFQPALVALAIATTRERDR